MATFLSNFSLSRPMRVLVVCNSDVAWSRTETEYWASLRDWVQLSILEIPFGTACLTYTGSGDYWNGVINGSTGFTSRTQAWDQLFSPIGAAAEAHNAQAIFWGPATPTMFRLFDEREGIGFPPGRNGTRLVTTAMTEVRGWYAEHQLNGMLDWTINPSIVVENGLVKVTNVPPVPFIFNLNSAFRLSLGRAVHSDPEYVSTYPGFENVNWPPAVNVARYNIVKHRLWRTSDDSDAADAVLETSPPASIDSASFRVARRGQCLTGRIGRPVWHTDTSTGALFNGEETQAATRLIIDEANAAEGSISDHLSKPIWVGIHNRNFIMNEFQSIAALDILQRAGFSNLNYYTRSVGSAARAKMTELGFPPADAAFTYAGMAGNNFRHPVFLHLGYALTNQAPGSAVADASGVSGIDIDNAFSYQSGSTAFLPTSNGARHVMRCLSRTGQPGGVAGHGSVYETSPYGPLASYVYALLQGATICEAWQIMGGTDFSDGVMPPIVFGDPLYAPFGDSAPLSVTDAAALWGGSSPSLIPDIESLGPPDPDPDPDPDPVGGGPYRAQGDGIAYRSRKPQRSRTGGRPLVRS